MKKISSIFCGLLVFSAVLASGNMNSPKNENEYPKADLSEFEKDKKGWITLFDGKTFNGWRGYCRSDVPVVWSVKNGELCVKDSGGRRSKEGGDLIFAHKFKNFEFEVEWKASKKANSGIFYLAQEIEGKPIYASAPECQLLDNENHPDSFNGKDGNHKSSSLYDMIPAEPQNANPHGEWNKTKIVCKNGRIKHYQNDVEVVSYKMWGDQWKSLLDNSKFKKMKGAYELLLECGGENREGYIGLQDHGDEIAFKNIRIRILR